VAVRIQGAERTLIIDSGSSCSLLQPGVAELPLQRTSFEPFGVTGDSLDVIGEQQVSFQIGTVTFNHSFLVCKLPTFADGIIGLNFLTPRQAKLDLGSLFIRVCLNPQLDFATLPQRDSLLEGCKRRKGRGLITHVSISQNRSRDDDDDDDVGVESAKSARKSNLRNCEEVTPPKTRDPSSNPPEVVLNESKAWTVACRETVVLQPRAKHTVLGKVLGGGNSRNPPCLLCVEPAHVPIEGICVARVLTRPSVKVHGSQPARKSALLAGCTQLNSHAPDVTHDSKVSEQQDCNFETGYPSDSVMLIVVNFSEEKLTLPKGTILGIAQGISENLVVSVSDEEIVDKGTEQTFFSGSNKEVSKGFKKYVDGKLAHLSRAEKEVIEPVLIKYAGIFHDDEDNDFRSTNVVVHKIETGDATPIKKVPYKTPFALRGEMNRQVQKMLDKGVISASHSPWSSPVVLVPKKSGTGVPKYRFCVDFRALNAITKYDSYPYHVLRRRR
jgi:hypothetical protein